MEYIMENREQLILVLGAVVGLASAICALTPTPKEGSITAKLYKLVEWAALNVGKAKDKGEEVKEDETVDVKDS